MKKILSLILIVCVLLSTISLTGCSEKETNEVFFKEYQTLSYTDFNNIVSNLGYTPVENTDNSQFEFNRSFFISDEDTGLTLLFFEAETPDMCYLYFNQLVLAYENFTADYATMKRYNNIGLYTLVDEGVIIYIAFVENTILASVTYMKDPSKGEEIGAELEKLVTALEYPAFEYHVKGE